MAPKYRLDTELIHGGEPHPRIGKSAVPPIFQSTVFETVGGGGYDAIPYPRLSNLPNHAVLSDKLALLEGAEDAMVLSSGMAAISSALLAVLQQGDHMLVQDCLYGGTHGFVGTDLPRLGITSDSMETAAGPDAWAKQLRPETKAIYVEALTNPLVQMIDHAAVVAFAKEHSLVTIIDATFASPVNFRPIEHGYDLALHSATKYLNGHSDLVAGCVAGSSEWVGKVRHLASHLGGSLDPHACFLLHRGLRTLGLRVRQQNVSALAVARCLEARSDVVRVHYPGLESHAAHALAGELFDGFGGMLAFEPVGGSAAAAAFLEAVVLPIAGPSLGGVETLVSRPAMLSHSSMSREVREAMGIRDELIRVSIGIEATEDLIADFSRALESIQ